MIRGGGDHIISLGLQGDENNRKWITANGDGSYYFNNLTPGTYIVRVNGGGYNVSWTACGGNVGSCHSHPDKSGTGTEAAVGLNGGYIDLWFDFTPVQTASNPSNYKGYIIGSDSGRCLDVYGAGTTNESPMDIYDCVDQSNQKWRIEGSQIIGVGSGRCLDIPYNQNNNGQRLWIYDCNGTPAQQWTLRSDGSIQNAQGKCVDVKGFATGNSSDVQIWDCSGAGNQRWYRN